MTKAVFKNLETPIGDVRVAWCNDGLVAVELGTELSRKPDSAWKHAPRLSCEAIDQLRAYFAGELREFDLPLVVEGTEFQERVWRALAGIPFGETISYAELARRVGQPRAVRAVGTANGRNRHPIVLPCHRVIGSDGTLHGYGGGVHIKSALLTHERNVAGEGAALPLFG